MPGGGRKTIQMGIVRINLRRKRWITIYRVNSIKNIEQLDDCPIFHIDQYQWSKNYKPKAYGQMALLENFGIVISMTAKERNPLRRFTENDDPVYQDSALEVFLNFAPERQEMGYLNFEMNANGALLSGFGLKANRMRVKQITSYRAFCTAKIEEDCWNVILKIPMGLICELYQIQPLKKGDVFSCNFYKICEELAFEHYASYAPLLSRTPNFHLPEYFEKVIIRDFI